jgi:hypothetical protein
MYSRTRFARVGLSICALTCGAPSCSDPAPPRGAGSDDPSVHGASGVDGPRYEGRATQALAGGALQNALRSIVVVAGCTGTVIGPRHILSAGHCALPNVPAAGYAVSSINVTNPVTVMARSTPAATTFDVSSSVAPVVTGLGPIASIHNVTELDLAVVVMENDIGLEPLPIVEEPMDEWAGREVYAVGAGGGGPAGQTGPWGAWFRIAQIDDGMPGARRNHREQHSYAMASQTAAICGGDSGGPDLAWINGRWAVAGIHATGACSPGATAHSIRADRLATHLRSLVPLRGTFTHGGPRGIVTNTAALRRSVDGDDAEEALLLVGGYGGSARLMRYDGGSLMRAVWSGPSDVTIGRAEVAIGDTDGDGRADLVLQRGGRIEVFPGTVSPGTEVGAGDAAVPGPPVPGFNMVAPLTFNTWNNLAGTGPMLQYSASNTNLALGDFNHDGRADLLFQAALGLFVYEYNPTTMRLEEGVTIGCTPANMGNCWPENGTLDATFTVGDFNADGWSDVIVQEGNPFRDVPYRNRLYYGSSLTTTDPSGQSRPYPFSISTEFLSALHRGATQLVPGRFITNTTSPGTDMLVVTSTGTQLYESRNTGGVVFAQNVNFNRTDLTAGSVAYHVLDYNGDGLDDLLIATRTGVYVYRATNDPSAPFEANVWVSTDLRIDNTTFNVLDMNGDRRSDLWITTPLGSWGYFGVATNAVFEANQWTAPSLTLMSQIVR